MLAKLNAALRTVVEAIAWTDSHGHLEWCNATFEQLLGQPASEITGKPLAGLLPLLVMGQPVSNENHPITLALAGCRVETTAYEYRSSTTGHVLLELSAQPVPHSEQSRCVVLTIRDITRRNDRERTLLRQRELIELLQRVSEACNAADSLNHAVERTLQLVCLNMGFAVGHAAFLKKDVAADIWHTVSEDHLPRQQEVERDAVLQNKVRDSVIRDRTSIRHHGLRDWVATAVGIPVLRGADLIAVLEFYGDRRLLDDRASLQHLAQVGVQVAHVVERKRAESAILAAHSALEYRVMERTAELQLEVEERRKAENMKDELVATVSHELRTPLASLLGFSELMLDQEFTREEQRQFLGIIHSESARLTELINDFLDLQKIESGGLHYDMRPVSVAEILLSTAAVFRTYPATHCITVDFDDPLPLVLADEARLRQVFANLVSNAVKFSPRGGEIRMEARRGHQVVNLAVVDQGIGIPAAMIPKLFRKFVRVDNADTRKIGGTGLGLALVREIVLAHKGDIWVESRDGEGSTFRLTLPVVTPA